MHIKEGLTPPKKYRYSILLSASNLFWIFLSYRLVITGGSCYSSSITASLIKESSEKSSKTSPRSVCFIIPVFSLPLFSDSSSHSERSLQKSAEVINLRKVGEELILYLINWKFNWVNYIFAYQCRYNFIIIQYLKNFYLTLKTCIKRNYIWYSLVSLKLINKCI